MKRIAIVLSTFFFIVSAVEAKEPKSDKEKLSYAVGYQLGQSLKRESIDLDIPMVAKAIEDVLQQKKLSLTTNEMQQVLQTFRDAKVKEQKAAGEKNKKKGADFLAENKKKKGVIETASGLQYSVIKKGNGKIPKATDTVVVQYRGTLIDGKEFDSSYSRGEPTTFPLNRVIKGWQEGLKLMDVGSKWKLFIPFDLAYGAQGAGVNIGPFETLIFEVELLDIK